MPFWNIGSIKPFEILPGVHIRAPFGKHLMLSYLELDTGAIVPLHKHPHEQGGVVLEGTVELTIGDEVRTVTKGDMYLVPSNLQHKAVAVDGPAVILDVFSPVREDYAERFNSYIPADSHRRGV
jgi:quercetin dioxygenase-like cupin family protein